MPCWWREIQRPRCSQENRAARSLRLHRRFALKRKARKPLKDPAIWAALLSACTLAWGIYSHISDHVDSVAKEWREGQQDAYQELLTISAQASAEPMSKEGYEVLYAQLHKVVRGKLELLGSGDVTSCAVGLDNLLWSCAHPDDPNASPNCTTWNLHLYNMALSTRARASMARSWNLTPAQFQEDRFSTEMCGVDGVITRARQVAAEKKAGVGH